MLDLPDTPWVAGLLEGEGSFTVARKLTVDGALYEYPQVSLKMCDHDVVERVARAIGASSIHVRTPKSDRHSVAYFIKVNGDRALEVMRRIRPWMGDRRGRRIDELLGREYGRAA